MIELVVLIAVVGILGLYAARSLDQLIELGQSIKAGIDDANEILKRIAGTQTGEPVPLSILPDERDDSAQTAITEITRITT